MFKYRGNTIKDRFEIAIGTRVEGKKIEMMVRYKVQHEMSKNMIEYDWETFKEKIFAENTTSLMYETAKEDYVTVGEDFDQDEVRILHLEYEIRMCRDNTASGNEKGRHT